MYRYIELSGANQMSPSFSTNHIGACFLPPPLPTRLPSLTVGQFAEGYTLVVFAFVSLCVCVCIIETDLSPYGNIFFKR